MVAVTVSGPLLYTIYLGLSGFGLAVLPASFVFLAVLVLFYCLTVSCSGSTLEVSFGIGLIRKRFRVDEIVSCRIVRNRWWYGWGIRKLPRGWLFNVSGLDAIEIALKNGRVYRIGTDEPRRLCDFLSQRVPKSAH